MPLARVYLRQPGPRRRRPARCGRGRGRSRDAHVPRPGEQVRVPATPFRQAPAVPCGAVNQTPPAITTRFAAGVTTRSAANRPAARSPYEDTVELVPPPARTPLAQARLAWLSWRLRRWFA